jgi:hypothetical protein
LEKVANMDVTARLEQIRSIVNDINIGSQQTIAKAEAAIRELEKQVDQDAVNLLYRAQCSIEVALTEQLQRAFQEAIANLIKSDQSVKILGIKIIDLSANKIELEDPDLAYRSYRDSRLAALKKLGPHSEAYLILSTYQNLERHAWYARCHYAVIQASLAAAFTKEIDDFERLSRPWFDVVHLSL